MSLETIIRRASVDGLTLRDLEEAIQCMERWLELQRRGVEAEFATLTARLDLKRAAEAVDSIPQRERRVALRSFAGTLRNRGLTAPEILACLGIVNAHRCKPPLPEVELVRIAQHFAQMTAARPLPAASEAA